MANIVAFDDVKHTRIHRIVDGNQSAWRTNYMIATDEEPEQPVAFLAECGPQRVLRTHYHHNDQFQIFVSGDGHAGKHPIKPFQVHFARAHTPYGPIVARDAGVAFLTLRTRKDPGAQYLPDKREELVNVDGRNPWQLTCAVEFPEPAGPIAVKPLEGMRDGRGLAAHAIGMKPKAVALGPDASDSNGQYIVVLGGSVIHEGRELKATTIIFVEPQEDAFKLEAGAEGLQAVALNFPRSTGPSVPFTSAVRGERGAAESQHAVTVRPEPLDAAVRGEPAPTVRPERSAAESKDERLERTADVEYKVWQCLLCSFVYDEAAGMPEDGVPPGTRWADVPEDWGCPDCSAKKNDFEMVEI